MIEGLIAMLIFGIGFCKGYDCSLGAVLCGFAYLLIAGIFIGFFKTVILGVVLAVVGAILL